MLMSSGGRQDPQGQPAFSSDYLSGEGEGRECYLCITQLFYFSVSTCAKSVQSHMGSFSSPFGSV